MVVQGQDVGGLGRGFRGVIVATFGMIVALSVTAALLSDASILSVMNSLNLLVGLMLCVYAVLPHRWLSWLYKRFVSADKGVPVV